ncbi:putative cAMP phosphodiesterase A [Trypanosoma conorhini]|uniref:Phosphodiesterase n=1 Tax=Trypanosoma conorhini TaxID=83891 RepID=A0A3R7NRU8_9TRYP|nr:putative cAMP phosphodiesterase A [Trypanosoma conorhini]RNF22454.1 putative cAMP phosphodiesterase A [Trypanosoma conorhini]
MSEIPGLPVPRSRWVERGESCATCGKRFSLFVAKSNCPCCGKLCCSDCVQAECAIVDGDVPSKVCIDCFSMLQSNRPTGPAAGLPLLEVRAASAPPPRTPTPPTARGQSAGVAHVRAEGDGRRHDVWGVGAGSGSSPGLQRYVDDLLNRSELLRRENDSLLRHLREQGLELQALRVERDRAAASVAPGKKDACNQTEARLTSEGDVRKLRDQLGVAHIRLGAIETELKNAVARANSSEASVKLLQERICMYEDEVARLLKSQRGVGTATGDVRKEMLSTRQLPPSIVQDTVLTVVPPNPCAALGLEVNLRDWKFDSFEVASRVPSVLQSVAMNVAEAWNFFSSQDEAQTWARLAAAMENNYRPNPYHNATHAADVLQGVFSLVTAATPLMHHVTPLELKAVAFAAMAHDVRHPGRTNAFMAAVQDPVSYKFSGNGILEQLHAATAFELLTVPEFDFTSSMDNASFLEFKNTVTHLILRTDMTLHRETIAKLGAKVGTGGLDCTRKDDRLEALSFILHAADIGAPSRGVVIAKRWLVVLQEFADQAEDERRRGLPVTPGFDKTSSVESSQIPFLDFFVIPTFDLLQQLFPSIEEPLHNLRKLREVYAAAAGVTTPFPPPVNYRSREEKLQRMEAELAEYRSRGGEIHRLLEEVKAAGLRLRKKSAALKVKEAELSSQMKCKGQGEGEWRLGWAKAEDELPREREVAGLQKVPGAPLATGGGDGLRDQLGGSRETIEACECGVHEREAALAVGVRSVEVGEKRLVTFPEKLAGIAERLQEEQKRSGETEGPAFAFSHRQSALVSTGDISSDMARLSLTQHEAEERLARKYNEVDELLLIVRAMRMECAARSSTDVRRRALSATLAEREAAIAEAVELSRQRRRHVEEGKGRRPTATQLDRLESAIFQLKAAITSLSER